MSSPSLAEQAASRAADSRARVHEQEVRRLLAAGLALMREGGTERPPRVADIVSAAGLSNQAFYRYFASKDDLVAAVIDEGQRRLLAYAEHQSAKERTPEGRLRRVVRAVADQAGDPEVAAATRAVLWNAGKSSDPAGDRSRELHDLLVALLLPTVVDLGSRDPERDTRATVAAVISLMLDHLWQRTSPGKKDLDHVVAFCLAGIRGPA